MWGQCVHYLWQGIRVYRRVNWDVVERTESQSFETVANGIRSVTLLLRVWRCELPCFTCVCELHELVCLGVSRTRRPLCFGVSRTSVFGSVTDSCVWECHAPVCLGVSRPRVFGSVTNSCVWECHELVCLGVSRARVFGSVTYSCVWGCLKLCDQECHEPVYFEMSGVHRVIQDKDVW